QRAIRTHGGMGPLSIEDIARNELGATECLAPVRGINEGDGRLDIRTGLRLEDEARPRDVHAIAEWTRGIGVHRDPFLVIEGAGRAGAIESEACIVDVAPAVESDGRITARIVDATREALHAGNQSSEML